MKILLIIPVLALSGCFMGVRTKTNYHISSIPPSVARDLKYQCQMSGMWKNLAKGLLEYEQHMRKIVEDKVRDLEMENAALKAANKHLLEQEHGK